MINLGYSRPESGGHGSGSRLPLPEGRCERASPSELQVPTIEHIETYRQGALIYARVLFSDPANAGVGFGFRGVNSSGWAEEAHPFASPSYGSAAPGRVDYPFNHACGTPQQIESDVEFWIVGTGQSRSEPRTVHLSCSAPVGS